MKKTTSSRKIGVFLSKKSEASSTITGNSVNSSTTCLVYMKNNNEKNHQKYKTPK